MKKTAIVFVFALGTSLLWNAHADAHHGKQGFDRLEPIEQRSCSYRWGCKKHPR